MNLITLLKEKKLFSSYLLHCSEDFFHLFYKNFIHQVTKIYSPKAYNEIHFNDVDLKFYFKPQFSPYEFFFFSETPSKNFYEKLLKILEEPPYPLVFFFRYESHIPKTIQSRSLSFYFKDQNFNEDLLKNYQKLGQELQNKFFFYSDKYLTLLKTYLEERPYHLQHLNLQLELFQLKKDYEACTSSLSGSRS